MGTAGDVYCANRKVNNLGCQIITLEFRFAIALLSRKKRKVKKPSLGGIRHQREMNSTTSGACLPGQSFRTW